MQYVYTVYQEKSFTKAAEKLFISQPALSAMVKKAENEISAAIFDRSTTPISLTDAGKQYIYYVEHIMEVYRQMEDYFKLNIKNIANDIRVGGTAFFCSYIFPPVIKAFKEIYPAANFQWSEATNLELADRLSKGALDLFMEVDRIDIKGINQFSWGKEALLLAVPQGLEVNKKLRNLALTAEEVQANLHMNESIPGVKMKAFKDEKFILIKEGNDSYTRGIEICANEGFEPNIFMKVDSLLTSCFLASEGHGVAFVRDEILNALYLSNKLFFYKIDDPLSIRDIYVYYQEGIKMKPIVEAFLTYMREHPFRV
jgi:DNA-binding transcriptional LysR family regulator